MEDDSDIYSDLPLCNFDDKIEKLKASNETLSVEIVRLQEELVKITNEKDEYQTRCATLTKNISSLLKTAQAEIQRKDRLIKELRNQINEVAFEKHSYRKRKAQKDFDADVVLEKRKIANGLLEGEKSTVKDCFSSFTKENGSALNETKEVSISNNVDNTKQGASAVVSSNSEIGLLRKNTNACLPPFGNVQCRTLYSQRMLNKMQGISTTNGSSGVNAPKINCDKENHNNDNIANRPDFSNSSGARLSANENSKKIEDKKLIDTVMKSDYKSANIFLVPEVSGITKLTNSVLPSDKKPTNVDNMQLEALFGSPLKWTENSNETVTQMPLNSPTVYEDSCSAHIENAKFTLDFNKSHSSKPVSIHKGPLQKITPINKCTTAVERQEINQHVTNKEDLPASKWIRAFENVSDKFIQKPKSSVMPVLKKDLSKFSSISVNVGKETSLDIPHSFLFKSRYEDSVLGQFDDTTQFVSALTKVESKISPLNTPVKCSSQILLPANTCTSMSNAVNSNPSINTEIAPTEPNKPVCITNEITNSHPVSKDINEKPINILQPRKTPRIINYHKTKAINNETSKTATETSSKVNRFAINEEFICKQEEKVLKKCLNKVKDPIAIKITAKGCKSKDPHSPKGKTLRSSPKGKQKNSSCISKLKQANFASNFKEENICSSNRPDEINGSENITVKNPSNLLLSATEHSPTLHDGVTNKILEKTLYKSHISVQEDTSKLHDTSEKLAKKFRNTQENLQKESSIDKHQSKLLPDASENSTSLRRSREKQMHKLPESKQENLSNIPKCHEKLQPQLLENKEDILKNSCQKYLSSSQQQSNNKNSFNLSANIENNVPGSYQTCLDRPNALKIHKALQNETTMEKTQSRSHETRQHQPLKSKKSIINQEKSTVRHHSCEQFSSSIYANQNSERTSSNRIQTSPEIQLNSRFEENQLQHSEAQSNLLQDCRRKTINVLSNTREKRVSRTQNFKPSSQLRKQADIKEKIYQSKEIDDNHKSPKDFKSFCGNSFTNESPAMTIEKVPIIVRSSKRPEFASTTLSDDDYASRTPTKSAEHFKNGNCEIIEHIEWILRPITFDSNRKSVKEQVKFNNQRTVPYFNVSDPRVNPQIPPTNTATPKFPDRQTDSSVTHKSPCENKVLNPAPSPNKIICAKRRPLKFGVSVLTH